MASLRQHRGPCIRAALSVTWAGATGFRKKQRNMRRHLQVADRRKLADLAEAIWRELLDLDNGDLEEPLANRSLGAGLRSAKPKGLWEADAQDPASPKALGLAPHAAHQAPATLEAIDVDMQPTGEGKPAPELPEAGRHLPRRGRGTRPLPRLGGERDRGPRRLLSKRKLELLLVEPEKNKRKKYYAA